MMPGTRAIDGDFALVTLPPYFAAMPAVFQTLPQFDRNSLEGLISVAISLLDAVDGDPDIEPTGDEADAAWIEWHTRMLRRTTGLVFEQFAGEEDDESSGAEDDFVKHRGHHSLGCPVGDPDAEHDGCEHEGGY